MPVNLSIYPPYWPQFSRWVIYERANQQCECTGQCGKHGGTPGTRRCQEVHRRPARWARGTIHLSTAHLCTCDPPCTKPGHVIAACQRCHLRIDRFKHAETRKRNGTQFTPDWLRPHGIPTTRISTILDEPTQDRAPFPPGPPNPNTRSKN